VNQSILKTRVALLLLIASFNVSANVGATANTIASQNLFVSSKWVNQNQDKLVLIDLSSQSSYQKYHLSNAIWMNYNWLIRPQNGLALSGGAQYMTQVLSELGIQRDDHIVIYDDMGNLDASRLYWELNKLQHPKVNILDGGTVDWVLNSFKVTQTVPERLAKSVYLLPKNTLTNELTADKQDVLTAIKDPNTLLLDIRTEAEYLGDPKQKRSGHIPTALWFDWTLAINAYNGFKQDEEKALLNQLADIGVQNKQQAVIIYCNSGHRAARSITMLQSLGFNNVKLYDASMQEYGIDESLPLMTGKAP